MYLSNEIGPKWAKCFAFCQRNAVSKCKIDRNQLNAQCLLACVILSLEAISSLVKACSSCMCFQHKHVNFSCSSSLTFQFIRKRRGPPSVVYSLFIFNALAEYSQCVYMRLVSVASKRNIYI